MNSDQLQNLLHEVPAPDMRVDVEQVISRGRARQWRTRAGALAATAAAAVLVVALVLGGQNWGARSVSPARQRPTTAFFQHDQGLAPDQVHNVALSANSMTTTSDVLTVVRAHGQLTVRGAAGSAVLPVAFTVPGVLGDASVVVDGHQSILLVPVPADATSIQLDAKSSSSTSQGAVLANGTPVAVVITRGKLSRGALRGWFWGTSNGGYEYSTGERAATVRIGGNGIFYLPRERILGTGTTDGRSDDFGVVPMGQFLTTGSDNPGGGMQWRTVALVPRGAHALHLHLPEGLHSRWAPALRTANLPGTQLTVLALSLTSRTRTPGHPVITWTGSNGSVHSIR